MLKKGLFCSAIVVTSFISGCASLTSQKENDPLEPMNRVVHSFNEKADEYVMEPVAKGYQAITPDSVDNGITNFFRNLDDVVVFVNDILQLKFKQAGSDGGRFLVNTTVGVLGFMDVATDMGMPKHNEDFGQTLGAYGVGTGPYIVLPFLGPSNLRDTVGVYADTFVDPIFGFKGSDALWAVMGVKYTDLRADLITTKNVLDEASLDQYEFLRSGFFQRREYLVYDGNPPEDENFLDEE
jgi:phospholipid-binding lipoprotein MlaA